MEQGNSPSRRRQGRRSIVGPLILIALGVIFLLNTMGVLPWNAWSVLWRLWPLVLVLVGVELLFGRDYPWLSALVAVLVIAAAALLLIFAPQLNLGPGWTWGGVTRAAQQDLSVPLDGANGATVTMKFGAINLNVGSLGQNATDLLQGEVRTSRSDGVVVEQAERAQGGGIDVTLRNQETNGVQFFGGEERWDLSLNPQTPLGLVLQGGAADVNLDLRQLQVHDLSVELGASSLKVKMPQAAGDTRATIKAGAASVEIEVPQGVAARIVSPGGLTALDVDEGRFPKQGNIYVSPNYSSAQNRVEIDINSGLASVKVR
ncbi:MAG: LiaI-LiaF-like domain-containing protein [Chloroflexota bacterium]